MIRGLKDHLFAVLRDVVFISNEIMESGRFDLNVVREHHQCRVPHPAQRPGARDCRCGPTSWCAGAAIPSGASEYDYTKKVGYELGLRGLDVCTGCGPGAMKGPMKGATIGHSKQRIVNGRYLGITRARHHRRRAAQSHREPAGHHAGHREAPGGVRAPGSRHRRISPAAPARPRRFCICSAFCSIRPTASIPFPVVFTGPADCAGLFPRRSTNSSARRSARARSRATRSSSTIPPAWRAPWCMGFRRCAITAAGRAIPTASIGC